MFLDNLNNMITKLLDKKKFSNISKRCIKETNSKSDAKWIVDNLEIELRNDQDYIEYNEVKKIKTVNTKTNVVKENIINKKEENSENIVEDNIDDNKVRRNNSEDNSIITNNIKNESSIDEPTIIDKTLTNDNNQITINDQITMDFIEEISREPGEYNFERFQTCILKSKNKTIEWRFSDSILKILEKQITNLERKGKSSIWDHTHSDMVYDYMLLFPNKFEHSNLLGNENVKINRLRERLKNLNTKYCGTENMTV